MLAYLTPRRKVTSLGGTWDVTADYLGGTWLGGLIAIPVAAMFGWMFDVCGLTALCWVFGLAPTLILALTLAIRSRIDRTTLVGAGGWLSVLAGAVWSVGMIGCVIAVRAWRVAPINAFPAVIFWSFIEPIAAAYLLAWRTPS